MSTKRNIELLFEVGALRFLPRAWKQFLNPDCQNIPEHTFRVMLLALMIAKVERKGNVEKIIKMALIHDLPESRTGDLHYMSKKYATRNEELALGDMFKGTALEGELFELWKEFEARKSIEAKIVKDADWLDIDLELVEQAAKGHTFKKRLYPLRLKTVYAKLSTATAKKLFRAIYKADPHDWHLNARNTFNEGEEP